MISQNITVINKLGLHARAAAKLVSTASRFGSNITISYAGMDADAKSIMSVMMLAAAKGSELGISCDGADEQEAMDAICGLINNYFDEDE
jgi:phosphocarrier protein